VKKDRLFEVPIEKQFEFDERVAAVFDDMIERSVPFYRHNLELIVSLLLRRIKQGMRIVDLGSSTGALLIELAGRCEVEAEFIGVDNAPAMVELARKKAQALEVPVSFVCADLMRYDFGGSDIIIANYTLQFIRPLIRNSVVAKIYQSLKDEGLFICSEKVLMESKWLNKQIIDIYYDYKKGQGYSETEIMRKREALENVLIPYTIEENSTMMKTCGFKTIDTIFQWGNFVTMAAFR
jgi:tRNA (cmo5U34)-methyltransferase